MARRDASAERSSAGRMDFRLSPAHKALIEKAAAYSGESLTGFAVAALVDEARRVVRDYESVVLSARDRERFLMLLDSAPAPSSALRRAARRHGELIAGSE
jgi:uncharacterized protein (DUF1778 family)